MNKPMAYSAEDAVYFGTFTGVSKRKGAVVADDSRTGEGS